MTIDSCFLITNVQMLQFFNLLASLADWTQKVKQSLSKKTNNVPFRFTACEGLLSVCSFFFCTHLDARFATSYWFCKFGKELLDQAETSGTPLQAVVWWALIDNTQLTWLIFCTRVSTSFIVLPQKTCLFNYSRPCHRRIAMFWFSFDIWTQSKQETVAKCCVYETVRKSYHMGQ